MPYKDRAKQLAYQRQWQQRQAAGGLCKTCRAPRKRSKYKDLCTRCGNIHRRANKRWASGPKGRQWDAARKHERIAQGICVRCGHRRATSGQICRRCRTQERLRDRRRRRDARTWWSVQHAEPAWRTKR